MSLLRSTLNAAIVRTARNFCRTSCLREESKVAKTAATADATKTNPMNYVKMGGRSHAPSRMEKTFLVWSGRYKSVAEVPSTVPEEAIEKARNKARIRIANYMMLATIIACCVCVYSGKQAASRGETVSKQNLEWHRQYNEQSKAAEGK